MTGQTLGLKCGQETKPLYPPSNQLPQQAAAPGNEHHPSVRWFSSGKKEQFLRGLIVEGPRPAKHPAVEGIWKKKMATIFLWIRPLGSGVCFPPLEFGLASWQALANGTRITCDTRVLKSACPLGLVLLLLLGALPLACGEAQASPTERREALFNPGESQTCDILARPGQARGPHEPPSRPTGSGKMISVYYLQALSCRGHLLHSKKFTDD